MNFAIRWPSVICFQLNVRRDYHIDTEMEEKTRFIYKREEKLKKDVGNE